VEFQEVIMNISLSASVNAFARAALFAGVSVVAFGPVSASADDIGIVVYNAQHESLGVAWAEAFTKETGIKVTLRKGKDMEFANQIVQEGAASPADVFLTENSPAMSLVDGAGLFEPIAAETLAQVPENFRPSNGHWVGVAARSTVFVYDKAKLNAETLPKSMLDLADPEWKGRWGASPSGADFQAIVSALLALKGEEVTASWLKAMKENATPYKGNSAAMKGANAGEVEGALIYHYYYFGDQAKTGENSGNVAQHYFKNQDPGAFVSISGGGVLASSQHKEDAQKFLAWVTGKGGQAILREGTSFEYAVGEGEASHSSLTPLSELDYPKVDPATLNSAKVTELMTAAGLL
jgi:iron(III) transport system substrate-binding protein